MKPYPPIPGRLGFLWGWHVAVKNNQQAVKEEDAHNKLSRCNLQREQQQQHKHSYIPFKYIINV